MHALKNKAFKWKTDYSTGILTLPGQIKSNTILITVKQSTEDLTSNK